MTNRPSRFDLTFGAGLNVIDDSMCAQEKSAPTIDTVKLTQARQLAAMQRKVATLQKTLTTIEVITCLYVCNSITRNHIYQGSYRKRARSGCCAPNKTGGRCNNCQHHDGQHFDEDIGKYLGGYRLGLVAVRQTRLGVDVTTASTTTVSISTRTSASTRAAIERGLGLVAVDQTRLGVDVTANTTMVSISTRTSISTRVAIARGISLVAVRQIRLGVDVTMPASRWSAFQ